ncbi:hypothetical protein GCM10010245_69730 [Streptomyces spectabilis]|nr:hypothetical protein GCM10010245_69730 [Streptomyces spectabilis]
MGAGLAAAVGARLLGLLTAVRAGLLRLLAAVRARLVVAHYWVSLPVLKCFEHPDVRAAHVVVGERTDA